MECGIESDLIKEFIVLLYRPRRIRAVLKASRLSQTVNDETEQSSSLFYLSSGEGYAMN